MRQSARPSSQILCLMLAVLAARCKPAGHQPEAFSQTPPPEHAIPCSSDATCAPLACLDAFCQSPNCPPGLAGCACAPLGQCMGPGVACEGRVCRKAGCVAGEVDCECAPGCAPGATCIGGFCRDAAALDIESPTPLWACDLLLELDSSADRVWFSDGVMGQTARRGRRLAISLASKSALPTPPAYLPHSTITHLTCFDSEGSRVASARPFWR